MIQAGTISTGSATTSLGRGLVLDELHQLVTKDDLARRDGDFLADLEAVGWSSGCMASARQTSSWKLCTPRMRLAPDSFSVRSMITGLSHGKFDGDDTSSNWRVMKETRAAFFGVMPRTSRVALGHQASCARKACCQRRKEAVSSRSS